MPNRLPTHHGVTAVALLAGLLLVAVTGCGGSSKSTTSTTSSTPSQPTRQTTDWPTYGFDPQRTRYLPTDEVKPPFKVAWRYDARHLMEYSPIVVGDTLYGIDNNGEAFALNTRNGKERWRRDVASLNASAPTYSHGRLYISNLSPGQVQALNASNGKVVWRHSLPGRTESSPLAVGNQVIAGCECGAVYSLNARTGKENWSTSVGGEVKASPAFDDGTVYVGSYGGQLTALRASNGAVRWTASTNGRIYATAAVAFGRVYVGTVSGAMYAFDQQTGGLDWSTTIGGYLYSAPAAAKAPGTPPSIYFGSYSGSVYALDARSGATRWSRYAAGPVSGAGSVIGDLFYAGDLKTTEAFGWRASDGKPVLQARDGAYNPAISDGRRLYLTGVRVIYSLHRARGRSIHGFVKKSRGLAG